MHDVGDPLQSRIKTLRSCHIVGPVQRRSIVLAFTTRTSLLCNQLPVLWALQYPCQGGGATRVSTWNTANQRTDSRLTVTAATAPDQRSSSRMQTQPFPSRRLRRRAHSPHAGSIKSPVSDWVPGPLCGRSAGGPSPLSYRQGGQELVGSRGAVPLGITLFHTHLMPRKEKLV